MPSDEVYATVDELKSRADISGSSDDTILTAYLTAASRIIDGYLGRKEYGMVASDTATAVEYPGNGQRYIYIPDAMEITEVAVKESVTDTTYTALSADEWRGFRGSPRSVNALQFGSPPYHGVMLTAQADDYYFLDGRILTRPGFDDTAPDPPMNEVYEPTVRVTARWGVADTVPTPIKEATIAMATIMYKRGGSGWSDVIQSGRGEQQRFIRKLDPGIAMMLDLSGYARKTIAGR